MANEGRQFDILDKAVAARFWDLYNRPNGIRRQDVDEWRTSYNQLAAYARVNSGVPYVASQWRDEEPRYSGAVNALMSKVVTANPANYDTSIKVKGCTDCGDCGKTAIPQLSYTPMSIPGSSGGGLGPGNNTIFSLGDGMRDAFNPLPFFKTPDSVPKEIAKDSMTGIIVALAIGATLWIIHSLAKKRAN